MKANVILFTVLITTLFATTACKKKQTGTTHTDIYLAGVTWIDPVKSKLKKDSSVATYWKNGVPVFLPGDSLKESSANGILVNGKDVFVVGDTFEQFANGETDIDTATYWKNGVMTKLGRGTIDAAAIKGNDLYMVGTCYGFGDDKCAVWKNGELDTLGNGRIMSIIIDGDDIYMAGCKKVQNENAASWTVATYWKNGEAIKLNNPPLPNTVANGMFLYDGDKYFAGSGAENPNVPLYWKNRDTITLSSAKRKLYGDAASVYIDKNNFYVCGIVYIPTHDGLATFGAVYWKNNNLHYLPFIGKQSFATTIAVRNNKIYTAGGDDFPVYWENDKRIQLGENTGRVFAIDIVNY